MTSRETVEDVLREMRITAAVDATDQPIDSCTNVALKHYAGRIERALADDLTSLLPGSDYMDPPDGGDVTLLEQCRRMSEDAAKWRALAGRAEVTHPDDLAVDMFATAMKAKLAAPQPEAAQTAGETHSDNAKDAARFRWLRDHAINTEGRNGSPWCVYGLDLGDCTPAFGAELVAMVDDAMANGIVCSPVPVESLGRDEPEPAPSAPADVEALSGWLFYFSDDEGTPYAMYAHDRAELYAEVAEWMTGERTGPCPSDHGDDMVEGIVSELIANGAFYPEGDPPCFARRLASAQQAGGGKGGDA